MVLVIRPGPQLRTVVVVAGWPAPAPPPPLDARPVTLVFTLTGDDAPTPASREFVRGSPPDRCRRRLRPRSAGWAMAAERCSVPCAPWPLHPGGSRGGARGGGASAKVTAAESAVGGVASDPPPPTSTGREIVMGRLVVARCSPIPALSCARKVSPSGLAVVAVGDGERAAPSVGEARAAAAETLASPAPASPFTAAPAPAWPRGGVGGRGPAESPIEVTALASPELSLPCDTLGSTDGSPFAAAAATRAISGALRLPAVLT